jgi:gamma-glutamylcyclotransferase (GGCT)/AIG2-like uncharacterized protein YtfP
MKKEKVFVYGTLRKGFTLHMYLSDKAKFVGAGTMKGVLYDLGEYPGVVPSKKGDAVQTSSKSLTQILRTDTEIVSSVKS